MQRRLRPSPCYRRPWCPRFENREVRGADSVPTQRVKGQKNQRRASPPEVTSVCVRLSEGLSFWHGSNHVFRYSLPRSNLIYYDFVEYGPQVGIGTDTQLLTFLTTISGAVVGGGLAILGSYFNKSCCSKTICGTTTSGKGTAGARSLKNTRRRVARRDLSVDEAP